MTTLNNRPVSRRIGTDQTYVASISNSTSTNFSNNSVTPGTIREGFSIQLTPRVLDDGRIMMQYSLSLIDIINLTNFSVGTGQSIQLPETSSRVFVQQAMLKSGSTLILGGYGDEQATQGSQGVGDAFNYFLGGGSTNAKKRTMLFIAITPQCLDVPRSEPDQQ
jgi:type IVB pilus formation R64 PilN family outer membrane protein